MPRALQGLGVYVTGRKLTQSTGSAAWQRFFGFTSLLAGSFGRKGEGVLQRVLMQVVDGYKDSGAA